MASREHAWRREGACEQQGGGWNVHNGRMIDRVSVAPAEGYRQRLLAHEERAERLKAIHVWVGYLRLLLVVLFLVAAWFTIFQRYGPRWLVAVPMVLFVAVGVYHGRVLRSHGVELRAAEVYRRGIARIEDCWVGMCERETRDLSAGLSAKLAASLYAADLDIIGRGGMFELLCTARTRMGEEMLLEWLLEPAAVGEILERQADVLRQGWMPWFAGVLAVLAVAAVVEWLRGGSMGAIGPIGALLIVLLVEAGVRRPFQRQMDAVLEGTDQALKNMQLLAALLEQMEGESFESARLREIKRKLSSHAVAGSVAIARLGRLGQYRDSIDNPIVRVALNLPLMYSVQLAFAIQRWRRRHGGAVRLWLEAVAEMEALLSLATYSYEHPGDPFPEFLEGEAGLRDGARLEAVEIGHPLIAAARCVRNSLQLGGETRVLMITGSNMSGKSTLMRTVGVNTVLAMCGAPVRARSLRLTPLRIGASLLVNDSLQEGHSRFYAEIERLNKICSCAEGGRGSGGEAGMLFLLDELLQGTNSKDRLIGAHGVVWALMQTGAIGIVTTHDLALAGMEGLREGGLKNMHFQDEIVEGEMRFDFRLREGVAMKSNGVELMRLIGLKV